MNKQNYCNLYVFNKKSMFLIQTLLNLANTYAIHSDEVVSTQMYLSFQF